MRESVQWFAGQMEKELLQHDEERGDSWEIESCRSLFRHLEQEVKELDFAMSGAVAWDAERVISECADAANMAMMIANNLRVKSG